tara:strand:+ start:2869 stop:3153 length:285 start_codon:yes stop_codon:yes gene_type:complete
MNELSKIQDNYYKDLEKKLVEDPLYSIEKVKELLEELTGSSTLIKDEEDLREWFWDYMYNEAEKNDFVDYLIDAQNHNNEFMRRKDEENSDTRE